jgi:hypothetical protein
MAQKNCIDVTVFPVAGASDEPDELIFSDVNYISLISNDTYGIPAVITDPKVKEEGLPIRVLYVNPTNIAAMEAVRKS